MQEEYPTIEEKEETEENFESSKAQETPGDIARLTIFEIGKKWEEKGDLFQAIPVYKYLVDKAPESTEANEAKEGLLKIAQHYQELDANYFALSLSKYIMEKEMARLLKEQELP